MRTALLCLFHSVVHTFKSNLVKNLNTRLSVFLILVIL